MTEAALWIAGQAVRGDEIVEITYPYDGGVIGTTTWATTQQVETAIAAAADVADEFAATSANLRAGALRKTAAAIQDNAEEFAQLITAENGKPLRWARAEVARAVSTFEWAAEETRRFAGDVQRLDTDANATGRMALTRRFPRGPVLGITPFNFPLNLVAHKIAPALAVGAPVIIKPAPATPLSALRLGELLADTDLPDGAVSVLAVPNDRIDQLSADPRLPVVSFTGSDTVGWQIRESLPRKHLTLELGGNAAALICRDWSSDEDLEWACTRLATFGNYQAGQSCIGVQRVFVERPLFAQVTQKLTDKIEALAVGDPRDPETMVGPMISVDAAQRVEGWVEEAVKAGAKVLCGGPRDGAELPPTLLSEVPADAKVVREEIFGPVVVVEPVDDFDAGLAAINDSKYGLQAGLFTHRYDVAARAHRELEVGGLIVGDAPSFRADQMPYGGTKDSGVGREGVASAMDDYTYARVMVLPQMY